MALKKERTNRAVCVSGATGSVQGMVKKQGLRMAGCQTALISTQPWIMTKHQGREERLCCVLRSTAGLYGTLQMLISVGKSELSSSKGMCMGVCLCIRVCIRMCSVRLSTITQPVLA